VNYFYLKESLSYKFLTFKVFKKDSMKNIKLLLTVCCTLFLNISAYAQNGLHFDGEDDYVQTNFNGIQGSTSRTVEAWIKVPTVPGQIVITDWGTTDFGARFTFALINGYLRAEIHGTGQTGTTLIGDETWHHVAVVYDNSVGTDKFTMYIDGEVEMSFDLTISVFTGSDVDLQIGLRIDGVKPFKGVMDEVRIWNYAKHQPSIVEDMFVEYCTPPSGLVAYHKFNHGEPGQSNASDTTSIDASGFGNHGALMGFELAADTSNWVIGQPLNTEEVNFFQSLQICDGLFVNVAENIYATSGTYVDVLPGASAFGCDSIITTDLTILEAIDVSTNIAENTISANTSGATYQWLDCDNGNAPIDGETGQSFTPAIDGNYAVAVTVSGCTEISECEAMTVVGVNDDLLKAYVSLYPNPAKEKVFISVEHVIQSLELTIFDITGKVHMEEKVISNSLELDIEMLEAGVYFVRISEGDNEKVVKLIKI
jgi:hypothetical protein